MKVSILGLPGSGKSTFAQMIASKKGIPHISIDLFWWEGGGGHNRQSTPNPDKTQNYVREKVLQAVEAESWVSDGLYPLVQTHIAERADTLVYLRIPLCERLFNHLARLVNRRERKDQMTLRADIEFFLEMLKGDTKTVKSIEVLLETFHEKVIILRSRKEMREWIDSI